MLLCITTTVQAGEYLGEFKVSRYYVPDPNQHSYANGWKEPPYHCTGTYADYSRMVWLGMVAHGGGSYTAEKCMNGGGHFADGTSVHDNYEIAIACPPQIPLGSILHVSNLGYARCKDRGGKIKGFRLDVFTGVGQYGFDNFHNYEHVTGYQTVHLLVE